VADSRVQTKGWDGIRKPPAVETGSNTLLSVSPKYEDCASLEHILKPHWTVIGSTTVDSAISVLGEMPIPIALWDCDVLSGTWGEMLDRISVLPDPPLLIVTSRLADERLWAEVLNLGAWDVLAKPYEADEVIRIVSIAYQHWQDRHGLYDSRTTQRKSARGTGYLALTGT